MGSEWFSARTPRRYRTRHIQVKEMYAVIYSVLCWGESFRGKHIIFHIDNDAVYRALNDITSRSQDTMSLLHNFLNLACRLDFTFSSLWLSSSANSLADAASRFLYNRLFSLAPHLNRQPCSKRLPNGGMTGTPSGLKPSRSIFGMASLQAHATPTSPVKNHLSTTSNSTNSTMQTAHSSPPLNQPSWDGSPASEAKCNPRPSNPTSRMSVPCIPTSTSPFLQSSRPSSNASYVASNAITVNGIGDPSNQSPYPSSDCSSNNSNQIQKQGMSPPTPPAASPTPPSFAAVSSPPDLGPSIPVSCHPDDPSSSSQVSKTHPTLSSRSQPLKQTPFERVSPYMLPPHPGNQPVPLPHSSTFSRPIPGNLTAPSSANKTARHSPEGPLSNPFGRHSFVQALTPPSLPDTAFDVEQHPRRQLRDVQTTRSR